LSPAEKQAVLERSRSYAAKIAAQRKPFVTVIGRDGKTCSPHRQQVTVITRDDVDEVDKGHAHRQSEAALGRSRSPTHSASNPTSPQKQPNCNG
jgi:hypothetical protein